MRDKEDKLKEIREAEPRTEIPYGGNWDHKLYRDRCYTIHMLGGNPYTQELIGKRIAW